MKNKKINKTSLITVLLAVLGVCLLLVGGIGGARAALTESDDYTAELKTPTVAVQLYEGNDLANPEEKTLVNDGDELLTGLLQGDKSLAIGKAYDEILTVKNNGSADAFVRVTLYKYWTAVDPESEQEVKRVDLDPSYINLILGDENWVVDEKASTPERTVVYCTTALTPDEMSEPLLKQISASAKLGTLVTQTSETKDGHTTITSTYQYDGLSLNVEASVDAIQAHNAQDAIKAAWGVDVTATETTLSLN